MLTHTSVSEVLVKHLRQLTASLVCILQSVTLRPLGLRQPANAAGEQSLEEDACPRRGEKAQLQSARAVTAHSGPHLRVYRSALTVPARAPEKRGSPLSSS